MNKKIIILLGLPGSGKGTQGAMLSKELFLSHISTGDIFRKMAAGDSEESRLLNQYMSEGKLAPSDLVNKIVRKYILSDECKKGCILDGYPRDLSQAEYFIENIEGEVLAIFFDTTDEVVTKRILGRYSCTQCGQLYNKFFNPTKKDSICDKCGSQDFDFRKDDDESTITKRLGEYKEKTLPLINYYKNKGMLFSVNADVSSEEVFEELMAIVKKN